jgi:hypothetical protein
MKRILLISFVFAAMLFSSCTAPPTGKSNAVPPPHPGLQTTGVSGYTDGSGYYNVKGEVFNNGDYTMKNVKVIATFYQGSENVGTATYAMPDVININTAVPFDISSYPAKIPSASYHLNITADFADSQP